MRRAVAVVVVLALPACTTGVRRARPTPSPSPTVPGVAAPSSSLSPTARVTASPDVCPASYTPPDPKRPRIRLTFELADDGRTVTGTEHVEFTPDLPVTELVFRAWPNAPGSAANGARLEITSSSLPRTVEPAGAGRDAPGTLIRLRLPAPVSAGTTVTANVSFRLRLPRSDVDRYGFDANTAWWGSGHPLFAWQRGVGWATEEAVGLLGETASNEAAAYDVTVTAPERYEVVGSGHTGAPLDAGGGRRRWHFANPVARDVAVVAGTFARESFVADGVPVQMAVGAGLDPRTTFGPIRANVVASMRDFTKRFGKFPYPTLTVVALRPIAGAGVEYPGLIFVGSRRYDLVVTHEMAHEWFYGLVGNNQATEPWLDESFATYAEGLVNDDVEDYVQALDATNDAVNLPMTYWDSHESDYGDVVYAKGAAALLVARQEAGPAAWDARLRCFVNREAYGIATAADLAEVMAPFPKSLDVLREAGALG